MPKKEKQELAEEGKKTKKASAKKADKKKATEDAFDSFDAGFKDVDVEFRLNAIVGYRETQREGVAIDAEENPA